MGWPIKSKQRNTSPIFLKKLFKLPHFLFMHICLLFNLGKKERGVNALDRAQPPNPFKVKVQYQIIEKDRVICELQTRSLGADASARGRGNMKLSEFSFKGLYQHRPTSAFCLFLAV